MVFSVNIDGIYWEKVKVAVNGSLLSRIFSNLTNNICKYADIDEQVVMETVYSKNIFEICISNTVCKEKSLLESTGLGLKNVELLMRRMHGRAIYETKENSFLCKIAIPEYELNYKLQKSLEIFRKFQKFLSFSLKYCDTIFL